MHSKVHGRTGFDYACGASQIDIMTYLVEEHNYNLKSYGLNGHTAFHYVCACENVSRAQFFVEHGFDITTPDTLGATGFHYACRYGRVNVVRYLLNVQFSQMLTQDNDGKSGFHYACEQVCVIFFSCDIHS